MLDSEDDLSLYAPECFSALRRLIAGLESVAREANVSPFWARYRSPDGAADHAVAALLGRFDAPHLLERLVQQHSRGPHLAARLREWFDGFRTLKLVHHLRETCHPSIPLSNALESAPFCASVRGATDLDEIRRALATDEGSTKHV
jgi:hypothetical protein